MAESTKKRITGMLLSKSRRAQYLKVFAVLAACVVVAVAVALHQSGVAMTHKEQVLTCPVTDVVAHTHNESCYDKEGNLVCTLPERELHTHTDECYTEVRELTCGQEESKPAKDSEANDGSEASEGSKGHVHTDDCYIVKRELTCGKEEITEEHVHGPGCFTEVVVEDQKEPADEESKEQEIAVEAEQNEADSNADEQSDDKANEKADGEADSKKDEKADEEADSKKDEKADDEADSKKDEKADDKADEKEVGGEADSKKDEKADDKADDEADSKKDEKADDKTDNKVAMPAQSFTGEIKGKDDKVDLKVEVEAPEGAFPANTTMEVKAHDTKDVKDAVDGAVAQAATDAKVTDIQTAEIVFRNADGDEMEPLCPIAVSMSSNKIADEGTSPVVVQVSDEGKGEVVDQLSDKQAAERQLDTGDNTIAFATDESFVYAIAYTVDFHYNINGKTYDFSIPGGGFVSLTDLIEILGIANGKNSEGNAVSSEEYVGEDALTLNGIKVSDSTKRFVADVKSVEFSNSDLVWVGKVETDSTVGDLKKANGLDVQYSAELTEEQINEINAQTMKSGDWALISKLPFLSEESLTVTMKDGEVFTIDVTDAQYAGTVVPATDLDGKTGAIVNTANNNAVLDEAHSSSGRLKAAAVTIGTDNSITTTDSGVKLTEWTFTKVEGQTGQYQVHSSKGYLNISNNGSVSVANQPQALDVYTDNNQIRIARNGYALNNWNNNTADGYATYDRSGNSHNRGEWFTIYSIEETFPVKLHFVNAAGETLEAKYADGTVVDENNIDLSKLVIGNDGIIDLNQFTVNGFTLSNTHKSTQDDINNSNDNYKHSIIGNELKWNNGTVQYKLYYTNNDKAGWYWFDAGTEPQRDSNHWAYNNGSDPSDHTAVSDNDENPYDYYLVYDSTTQATDHGDPTPITPPDVGTLKNSKELTSNYDGTFNLELGVSGKAAQVSDSNKINVIIVMDTSSSMTRNYWNENQASTESDSRLYNTKNALKQFVTDITAFNATNSDTVELAFITFNRDATSVTLDSDAGENQYWTTRGDTVNTAIDRAKTNTGTNWAWALDQANERLINHADGDPTYVLLVTDGAPSQYWHSTIEGYYVSGQGCYLGARDEARQLIRNGATLYGVFAFGPEADVRNDYLGALVDYAYNANVRDTYRFNVETPDALEERLSGILQTIDNAYGFSDVTINDGITELTTVTFENTDPESFEYSISYKDYTGTGPDDYTEVILTHGNGLTVSGSGNNQTITVPSQTYHVLQDGNPVEVTTEAVTLKGAVFTAKTANQDKKVTWSLVKSDGSRYTLQDGWNYKVKFKIWPSQPSYDILAALNNGFLTWGHDYRYTDDTGSHTITAEKYMAQIYQDEGGTYILRTNTNTSVTYKKIVEKTVNGETTYTYTDGTPVPLPDVGGMPLDNTMVQLTKQWNTTLSDEDYQNINDVDLYIIQDPTDEKTNAFNAAYTAWKKNSTDANLAAFEATYYKKVTLTKANGWKEEISIAPGIYDADGIIKETGHVYTVMEPGIDGHYELEVTPIHPMLDGTTHENEQQIYDMIDIYDDEHPTKFEMNSNNASVYTVENTLKGGININKEIVNVTSAQEPYINMDEYFTIKVTLTDSADNPVSSPNGSTSGGAVSYRIYSPEGIPDGASVSPEGATGNDVASYVINGVTYNATKDSTGNITGFDARGPIPTDGVLVLKIRECDSLRIVNVPLKTKYIVEEIVDDDSGFEYESGHWEVKKSGSVFEGNEEDLTTPSTGVKTIVGDAENNVVFKNTPQNLTKDLPIQKQTSDGSGLPGAVFQLLADSGSGIYSPVTALDGYDSIRIDDNSLQTIEVNGVQKESAFTTTGGVQTIMDLPLGRYKLVEAQAPEGYIITNPDTFFEVTTGGVTYDTSSEGKLVIINRQGDSLPNTGGTGTGRLMALGMMLVLMSGVGIAVKMRNNL